MQGHKKVSGHCLLSPIIYDPLILAVSLSTILVQYQPKSRAGKESMWGHLVSSFKLHVLTPFSPFDIDVLNTVLK